MSLLGVHMFKGTLPLCGFYIKYEPVHDKTYKIECAPSEDSDQPGHQPSLIRVIAVHSMGS